MSIDAHRRAEHARVAPGGRSVERIVQDHRQLRELAAGLLAATFSSSKVTT